MTASIHCPIIHGGLQISLSQNDNLVYFKSCCLRNDDIVASPDSPLWQHPSLIPLRQLNKDNVWDNGCWHCQGNELAGLESFRTGMLKKFGVREELSGPTRLDLMFDISCNLACRTCGPYSSTYWQKHVKSNNISFTSTNPISKSAQMIDILKKLDLSNLEMVVFCGGETLMGNSYWEVADTIASMVPNAKEKLTINFQTNGTQAIDSKYYELIDKFHLVRLNISLDGIEEKFDYLRWPARWGQVVENIQYLRETLPSNTTFLIEETISIFNLFYFDELDKWCREHYSTNRMGDPIPHTRHPAEGTFSLANLTSEYCDALIGNKLHNLIPQNFQENPDSINKMINEITKFDRIRGEDWTKTFPRVAEFYSRYIR